MVYEKANSVLAATVTAPTWIHKYVIGRKGVNIKKITDGLKKVHVEFTDKENKIKIEGPAEELEKAQAELEKEVKELLQTHTFEELKVDPNFHKHIIGKNGANVNRLKNEADVTINIGEEESSNSNVIRIEGRREGVEQVKKELQEMVIKLENEKEKTINIDHRFFPSIIGTKGEKIKEIRETFNQVQIIFPNPCEYYPGRKKKLGRKDGKLWTASFFFFSKFFPSGFVVFAFKFLINFIPDFFFSWKKRRSEN